VIGETAGHRPNEMELRPMMKNDARPIGSDRLAPADPSPPRNPNRAGDRRSIRERYALTAVAATLLFVAGACGGGAEEAVAAAPAIEVERGAGDGSSDDHASGADSSGADDQTDEDLALAFAQCMRDEGVDFEDPTVNGDGSIDLFAGNPPEGSGEDRRFDDATRDAFAECGDIVQGASFLPGGGDQTELEDDLLEFAQCLRDQGLDVDDPDLGGGFGARGEGGGGPFGSGFDPSDPASAEAIDTCQDSLGALRPGRGGD
jgi:hypothetical protein